MTNPPAKKIINQQRRAFIQAASIASIASVNGLALSSAGCTIMTPTESTDPWNKAQAIIDRFAQPLSFREEDFLITTYGAVPCQVAPVAAWVSTEERGMLPAPVAGSVDCYAAITAAIAACHATGGGRVVIPGGNWFCAGPIVLLSNVHVHLKAKAQIYFSNDPADYAKYGAFPCGKNGNLSIVRWQSNDCLSFSSMVYAYGQNNIALTGEDWSSILNGQGGVPFAGSDDCWWTWKGLHAPYKQGSNKNASENVTNPLNPESLSTIAPHLSTAQVQLIQGQGDRWRSDGAFLPALSEADVPIAQRIFGLGHFLRPCMIQLIGCTNVLLQGYQVNYTPFWQHNPIHCRDLHIRDVRAESLGPNSDGFDPESCDTVLVENCTFNTGDDCIAIKSGKDLDTQYGPTQNVVIQNCIMNSGHGAITLGSEMAGGIQNIYAQNLEFRNLHWATDSLNTAIRMKTNMNRGGFLKHFYIRNISIPNGVQTKPGFYTPLPGSTIAPKTAASAAGAIITIDCDYVPAADNVRTRPPQVSHVHISGVKVGNVTAQEGRYSCYQALLLLGPVASSYNGPMPMPAISPLTDITFSDCDFGTPVNAKQPWFLHNVQGVKLSNVTIAGVVYNTTLTSA